MFMVWDRLYRTYEPETHEPHYGTVKPLASWSPLWAQVHGWARLWTMAQTTSGFGDKLRVWVAPPEWQPQDLGGPLAVPVVDAAAYRRYESETPRAVDVYVLGQFVVVAVAVTSIMWFAATLPPGIRIASVVWVLLAIVAWGGLFEGKRWATWLEVARHLGGMLLGMLLMAAGYGHEPSIVARIVGVGSIAWLFLLKVRKPASA